MTEENIGDKIQQIDIEEVIRTKNPKLLKYLPAFIIRFIKKIIHQEGINLCIKLNSNKYGIDFISSTVDFLSIGVDAKGLDNLPENGRFVFASNHPLGGAEGIILTTLLAKKYGNIRVPVNDILLQIKNFSPVFIPLNKHGKNPREFIKQYDEMYSSDFQILMFPSGQVSRKVKGHIKDSEWEKSFLKKSIEYQRNIVPVLVDTLNSTLFYNVANLRNFFGIKANIELFLLPHELFNKRGKNVNIFIGKPISFEMFDKSFTLNVWANILRDYIYSLKSENTVEFHEFAKNYPS